MDHASPDPAWELWCYEGLRVGHRRALDALLEAHLADMAQLAGLYGTSSRQLLTHAWTVAFGGLPMFTWHTTMRAWLFGIVVGAGRSHGAAGAEDHQPPREAVRILAGTPEDATAGVRSAADLPFTSWWGTDSWRALDAWLRRRPLAEQEAVALIDGAGWSAGEARDALGWTDEHLARLHQRVGQALASALVAETGGRLPRDPAAALALAGQLTRDVEEAAPEQIREAFHDWRRTRGVSRGKRVAWLLRAGPRAPRAVLAAAG